MTEEFTPRPEPQEPGAAAGGRGRAAGRVLAGIGRAGLTIAAVVLLAAGGWAVSAWYPGVLADLSRTASSVVPDAVESTRVCATGLRTGGSMTSLDAGTATGAGDLAASSATTVTVQRLGQQAGQVQGAADGVFVGGLDDATIVRTGDADAEGGLAGVSAQRVDAGQVRGTLLTGCVSPGFDRWIGGGAQQTGRSTSVRLVNPSDLEATVTLTAYTGQGQLAAGAEDLTVPAGGERVLPLSALTTTDQALFVHVTAVRAPVAVFLQQTTTRTLTPGGADVQGPGAGPATSQTIVGMSVQGAEARAQVSTEAGWEDTQPVLRLLAPEAGGTATVHISGAAERDLTVPLAAGTVVDSPLGDLPDGDYRIDITADVPVVAAARVTSGGRDDGDLTWLQSAEATSRVRVAVPDGAEATTLRVAGAAGGSVTVTVDGAERRLDLDDAGLASLPVSARQVVVLTAGDPVRVALTTTRGGGIAATALESVQQGGAVDVLAR